MKTYLEFNELEVERKTKVFEVRNKEHFFLGSIDWANGWRQYVFNPTAEPTQLSVGCLKEIEEFIKDLMEERK